MEIINNKSTFYVDIENEFLKEKLEQENYTIYADDEHPVLIRDSKCDFENKHFSKSLSLCGQGIPNKYRCIEFAIKNKATIIIYAKGNKNTNLILTNDFQNNIFSIETSNAINRYKYEIPCAGTYYLMSSNSDISIFYININVDDYSEIKSDDYPIGFASINDEGLCNPGGYGNDEVHVSTKEEFLDSVKEGNKIIFLEDDIDISEGLLFDDSLLDNFISENTSFTLYEEFINKYIKTNSISFDDSDKTDIDSIYGNILWELSDKYEQLIKINLLDNTTIIGNGHNLIGAFINIEKANNISLRDIVFKNTIDLFPYHSLDDGYKAKFNSININSSTHIWIDNCIFDSTKNIEYVKTSGFNSEVFNHYNFYIYIDGLSDMITISCNKFIKSNNVMYINSSFSDKTGKFTVLDNEFIDCTKNQPFVNKANVHIVENYYHTSEDSKIRPLYCIKLNDESKVILESNDFTRKMRYSIFIEKKFSILVPELYYDDDNTCECHIINTQNGYLGYEEPIFDIPYNY